MITIRYIDELGKRQRWNVHRYNTLDAFIAGERGTFLQIAQVMTGKIPDQLKELWRCWAA